MEIRIKEKTIHKMRKQSICTHAGEERIGTDFLSRRMNPVFIQEQFTDGARAKMVLMQISLGFQTGEDIHRS